MFFLYYYYIIILFLLKKIKAKTSILTRILRGKERNEAKKGGKKGRKSRRRRVSVYIGSGSAKHMACVLSFSVSSSLPFWEPIPYFHPHPLPKASVMTWQALWGKLHGLKHNPKTSSLWGGGVLQLGVGGWGFDKTPKERFAPYHHIGREQTEVSRQCA